MKKIMFCGGGSAGHVIPNIALIEELRNDYEITYLGTEGIEKSICREFGVEFHEYDAVKLVRGKILQNLAIPFKLIKSIGQAGKILEKVKPDLLFCKGGYVCLPPAFAAKKYGIKVITHESDLTAGLANRLIARRCVKVLTTFPTTAEKFSNGIFTGSPMRKRLFGIDKLDARKRYGLDLRPTILVIGGGSGSSVINEAVRKIAGKLCREYNVLHLCGKGKAVETNIKGYKQIEFTSDMGGIYACTDYAVSRCGSNTANELLALKIPSLFIPLENRSSRGDQIKNAEFFNQRGLCSVLSEKALTPDNLYKEISALIKNENIKSALNAGNVKCGNEAIIKEIKNTLKTIRN